MHFLRKQTWPVWVKTFFLFIMMCMWKSFYYSPNTFKQLVIRIKKVDIRDVILMLPLPAADYSAHAPGGKDASTSRRAQPGVVCTWERMDADESN